MDLGLHGKTAVITGGSSGIGLAAARKFLAEGANVAICARGAERLTAARDALAAEFGAEHVIAEAVSVLDATAFDGFAGHVLDRFGGVDALVNNAGQGRVSTFAETTDDAWREELELKYFSQIVPIRAFSEALKDSGQGAIMAVNSLLAYQPEPHMVCTSSARAGVQNLLKSLSVEFAPEVRVNSILVGLVDSGQWQRRFAARADQNQSREAWYADLASKKNIPLGRLGEPEEAARALVFLASPAASYITGAHLEISGGLSRFV
ncbi:SDR family oxidoreductase [Amorphus sp. 3PC139-8]|uniref:SDR family oxidoreductase n=1 Tax=Amorphus sp. 3PC139-8 TaxID=2735676 RepID=UPI00345DBCF9